eukprot:g4226.t1
MATRNLTLSFMNFRDAAERRRGRDSSFGGDEASLLRQNSSGRSSWEEAVHSLPPRWVDLAAEIDADINEIEKKIDMLNANHRKRLMVSFDTQNESSTDREINILTADITGILRSVEKKLRRIYTARPPQSSRSKLTSEQNVRLNKQRALAARVQQLSMGFRKSQKLYMQKRHAQKSSVGAVGGGGVDFGINVGSGISSSEVDLGFSDEQMEMLETMEYNVDIRDKEIAQISKSIEELHSVFKDLSVLVIDQGTVLDRIDYNMECVVDKVQAGVQELHKAEDAQIRGRPTICISVLCVIFIILLILVILKFQRRGGGGDNNNG